jgi:tetratricopeptide (TPR) repeat protein
MILATVAAAWLFCSCESKLERDERMAVERANKSRQEALDALEEVKKFAATKNPADPAQIVQVIEKLESEDMRNTMTAVESEIQNDYTKILHTWNNYYLAICRSEWRAAKKAANDALRTADYDKALAALDNYPETLRTRAHEYWDDLQRYKEAIAKLKEAPGKAFEAITESESAIQQGNYPGAIEVCIRALRLLQESKDSTALRIVANEHIAVIDRWVDEIAKKEGKEAALKKLEELCSAVASADHRFYIEDKVRELGAK